MAEAAGEPPKRLPMNAKKAIPKLAKIIGIARNRESCRNDPFPTRKAEMTQKIPMLGLPKETVVAIRTTGAIKQRATACTSSSDHCRTKVSLKTLRMGGIRLKHRARQ